MKKKLVQVNLVGKLPTETVREISGKGEPVPAPDYLVAGFADPRIRLPMEANVLQERGRVKIYVEMDALGRVLPADELQHEIQHYIEKLNMALTLIVRGATEFKPGTEELKIVRKPLKQRIMDAISGGKK